jgi:hypothetical protein
MLAAMKSGHHILHLEGHDAIGQDLASMRAIYGKERKLTITESHVMGKFDDASAAIAAHGALATIAIEVDHLKIESVALLQKNEPITTYTEAAITEVTDEHGVFFGEAEFAIIYDDKVIARTLIFVEWKLHNVGGKGNQ